VSDLAEALAAAPDVAEMIRVRGLVQGVGFRPTVWRLAQRAGLRGWVINDGDGVNILVRGQADAVEGFVESLRREAPTLARIDCIERSAAVPALDDGSFRILASHGGAARTGVVPDAATCPQCRAEILPLPLHELHALRPAAVDHRGNSVRPPEHHDAVISPLPSLRSGISRACGSPLSRATDRLPRLRPARLAGTQRRQKNGDGYDHHAG